MHDFCYSLTSFPVIILMDEMDMLNDNNAGSQCTLLASVVQNKIAQDALECQDRHRVVSDGYGRTRIIV